MLKATIQKNTAECSRITAELQTLKELWAYAQPSPDILITGIPAVTTISHRDIVSRVLAHLNLSGLLTDILDIRLVNKKLTTASQSEIASPRYDSFSLIVKFKSVAIRNHVIDAKRKIGKITAAEILGDTVPATSQGTIYVNEFLPTPTYALYRKTKTKALESGHKRVWVKNGAIFVKKSDSSREIPIVTEPDLMKYCNHIC